MVYDTDAVRKIRERLKAGKLTDDDVKMLDELLLHAEQSALGTVGGRPIIARLPGGLDLIK